MTPLELPDQLRGPWERALFMSYGVDFTFFENTLLSQFAARCRQKIILLDGEEYLVSSAQLAQDGMVRHLNHRYVAAGVFKSHAVHAKLILLAGEGCGRLLVGSGNLNRQGYASGGELFCVYEYNEGDTGQLAAFSAVRELLEGLIDQRAVDPSAARHVGQFLSSTPWIYRPAEDAWQPVRHNLQESFLTQLVTAIGGEPVEELWVMSPFYDENAEALRQLLANLRPKESHLLVQPERTSVDPDALMDVIAGSEGIVDIHPMDKCEVPYVHAKMYLIKTRNRAICLQGSANLSQVAMLRRVEDGNVELCNLLQGGRNAFDYLLDKLVIGPATLPDSLKLALQKQEPEAPRPTAAKFYLISGEWRDKGLNLFFRGTLPGLSGCQLEAGDKIVPAVSWRIEGNRLLLHLSSEHHALFDETAPVRLLWSEGSVMIASNPVFLYHHADLLAELQARPEGEAFPGMGDLDIDDDLEQLIADLEDALVIDRRSVWRLAGDRKKVKNLSDDALDAMPLTYEDIDYEALRNHPKTQQYLRKGIKPPGAYNRLQIILGMITGRFEEIAEILSNPANIPVGKETPVSDGAESEEEREAEELERKLQRQEKETRLRQIFKRFIGRYLNGLEKPDFQDFVGYEVVTNNYIIFDHLLWALSHREWFFKNEPRFLADAQLRTWEIFWGADGKSGFVSGLSDSDRSIVLVWLREQKSDARLIAAVWRSSEMLASGNWSETRLNLRNFWRQLLLGLPFPHDQELLTDVWVLAAQTNLSDPPRATAIVEQLAALANYEREHEFLQSIERRFDFPRGSCRFESGTMHGGIQQISLCIHAASHMVTPEIARKILSQWMRYKRSDSYRISFDPDGSQGKVLLYEHGEKIFWDQSTGQEAEIAETTPADWPWGPELTKLRSIAGRIGKANLPELLPDEVDADSRRLPSDHS